MARVAILILALVLIAGCSSETQGNDQDQGQSTSEAATTQATTGEVTKEMTGATTTNIPEYSVTADQTCPLEGLEEPARCVSASTDAVSKDDLGEITKDLRGRGSEILIVSFYPNQPTADVSGSGYAFPDAASAKAVLSSIYPQGADIQSEVDRAMQNDGVYVISVADQIREATGGLTG